MLSTVAAMILIGDDDTVTDEQPIAEYLALGLSDEEARSFLTSLRVTTTDLPAP